MFDFFRKKEVPDRVSSNPGASSDQAQDSEASKTEAAKVAALKSAIEAQKKMDPMVGLKIGAKEVNQRLIHGLKNEKGVHIESFLTVIGALAGFSCQMSLREELIKTGTKPENAVFVIASGTDGKKYYFGDALNKPLAENQYSIWSVAAGTAQKLGAKIPDVTNIFKHVSTTVGGDAFGVPRTPNNHPAGDLPVNYLKVIWPNIFPVVTRFCDKPSEWPILFAIAIQEALVMSKDVIDPGIAVAIVMESAIPMSKIDLPDFY
jgi:hypothetical protein